MAKLINCDCGFVVHGETDEELLEAAIRHIEEVHPELVGKVTPDQLLSMAQEIA